MAYYHIPVMVKQAIDLLNVKKQGRYIDATLGGGGYTAMILERIKSGLLLSLDLDQAAIKNAEKKFSKQTANKKLILINDNFKNLSKIIEENFEKGPLVGFDGIVFDLGLSSNQLADLNRGFSFQLDAPLNMAFGEKTRNQGKSAKETASVTEYIVNKYSQADLERILREYGEEKHARNIAKNIIAERRKKPIKTTFELIAIIRKSVPAKYSHAKLHCATRTFQALRIETNQELENLRSALPQALELLRPGGRLAVVSYHSLEDRIAKRFFKQESRDCLCPPEAPVCVCGHRAKLKLITRKALKPDESEIAANPRARSAKLRAAEKI